MVVHVVMATREEGRVVDDTLRAGRDARAQRTVRLDEGRGEASLAAAPELPLQHYREPRMSLRKLPPR